MYQTSFDTPLGLITLTEENDKITHCGFSDCAQYKNGAKQEETPLLKKAHQQLNEYFAGIRKSFNLPLAPQGTAFQQKVWKTLQTIPYGQTASYKDIATQLGNPRACRAIGMANHKNPIGIIIPCHRVIGTDGGLVGYAGGLNRKQKLLELEQNSL